MEKERPRRESSSARSRLLAVLAAPALAALLYAPTLGGSFLSDDFLIGVMLDPAASSPRLRWSEALADFQRSWLGVEPALFYRPLVTVSLAANYAVGGTSPWIYRATNIALHVAASLLVALLCFLCCPSRPRLAAVLGGSWFALHPVAAEPVCWIAARTTSLAVTFQLASLVSLAFFLLRARRAAFWLCVATAALALASKESSVILPVSFLALDLLLTPSRPRRDRFRLHLSFAPIWIGYAVVRRLVIGASVVPHGQEGWFTNNTSLDRILQKVSLVLFAPANEVSAWASIPLILMLSTAAALAFVDGAKRRLLVIGGVWLVASLLPGMPIAVFPHFLGSRVAYGATSCAAIVLSMLLAAPSRSDRASAWLRGAFAVSFALTLPVLAAAARSRVQDYGQASDEMRALRADLAAVGADASAERPLAVVTILSNVPGIPFLNWNSVFPLGERPFTETDLPLVSLGFVWEALRGSEGLLHDASPMRALWEQGAKLLVWSSEQRSFLVTRRGVSPNLALRAAGDGRRFLFEEGPVDPYCIEALELEVAGFSGRGTLRWLRARGGEAPAGADGIGFRIASRRGGAKESAFFVDLSHSIPFLAESLTGGIAGFAIDPAEPGAPVPRVRALSRVRSMPLTDTLRGRRVILGEEPRSLRSPPLPRASLDLRFVLIGPSTAYAASVAPDAPLDFGDDWRRAIGQILRFSRQRRYYYYFEAREAGERGKPAYRSLVDWMVLERPPKGPPLP